MNPQVHPLWFNWLADEVQQPYFSDLIHRVDQASRRGPVYPPAAERYAAMAMSPDAVRVVILGQDPYHGAGQAHGLSFSVRPGVKVPPSLQNIYKEIEQEGFTPAAGRNGDLTPWAEQGVLLLNNVLSVAQGEPRSHAGWGWERFTDAVVQVLNQRREGLVFLLWGKDAATKAVNVDPKRHLVLRSAHPSPYAANSGFFGNGHFRKANDYLQAQGLAPIVW